MPVALQNSASPDFTGEFCHKVEGRNRITIPADWRFEEEIPLFLITRELKNCILVMTQSGVDQLKKEANALPPMERAEMKDVLGSGLRRVILDKGGRISIPDDFFDQLQFPKYKEVWLTGAMETFNMWSVPDFEESKAHEKVRQGELKRKSGI